MSFIVAQLNKVNEVESHLYCDIIAQIGMSMVNDRTIHSDIRLLREIQSVKKITSYTYEL